MRFLAPVLATCLLLSPRAEAITTIQCHDQRQAVSTASDRLFRDVKSVDEQFKADAIVEKAVKTARALKVPIDSKTIRKKLNAILISAKKKGLPLSGYSLSLFAKASIGVGPQAGYELVFLIDPQKPDAWKVAVYRFGGALVGPKAEAMGGAGINLIFNMQDLGTYAGPFCGITGGASAGLGLDAVIQASCFKDPKEKILTVGVTADFGVGAGAALSYMHYWEEMRMETTTSDIARSVKMLTKKYSGSKVGI